MPKDQKRRKPSVVEKEALGAIGLDANVVTPKLDELYRRFGSMESDNNPKAEAKESSAKGVYQYLNGNAIPSEGKFSSFEVALNRVERAYKKAKEKTPEWVEKARKHNDPRKLTRRQSDDLLIADLVFTPKPSKQFLEGWLVKGDPYALADLYSTVHHTDINQNANVKPRLEERIIRGDLPGSSGPSAPKDSSAPSGPSDPSDPLLAPEQINPMAFSQGNQAIPAVWREGDGMLTNQFGIPYDPFAPPPKTYSF